MTYHRRDKGTAGKQKLPSTVELRVPQRRIDVDAWLGGFLDRQVERDVHRAADLPPAGQSSPQEARKDAGESKRETEDPRGV
jgi:hypothetical protein